MKIGILTFHKGPNYGGFLQAWHLREAVRNLGYDATVINYQNPVHHKFESVRFPGLNLGMLRYMVRRWIKNRPFRLHVEALSEDPFTVDPSEILWSGFDVVVVGSDVIWDFSNPHYGYEKNFFGMAEGQDACRIMSYAASCGATDVDSDLPEYVCRGLKKFSHYGVRDQNAMTLVERCVGTKATHVVDPTWLQADLQVEWDELPDDPYLLVYGTGMNNERAKILKEYCRRRRWKIVSVSTPGAWADISLVGMDPWEWVQLFKNAEAVISGTLHGTLYAIKYNKPFVYLDNRQTHRKLVSILEKCGLGDRCVIPESFQTDHLEKLFTILPRDEGNIDEWVDRSKFFLENSLKV